MKFVQIKKPIAFDVVRNNRVIIPAGTENVKIAYRAAAWKYTNEIHK